MKFNMCVLNANGLATSKDITNHLEERGVAVSQVHALENLKIGFLLQQTRHNITNITFLIKSQQFQIRPPGIQK